MVQRIPRPAGAEDAIYYRRVSNSSSGVLYTPILNHKAIPHLSGSPKPHSSKPHPCNMPQVKTEVALQFLECCAAETALQHLLVFFSADVICTKSCAATSEKQHCNIEIAALQERGAFLPLSCGFQAPTFRHPRFGLADFGASNRERNTRTNFFLHRLFEHSQGSETSRQNSRDVPDSSLQNPRKTTFEGGPRTFRPPPIRAEDPHPTGRSPDPRS